MPDSKSTAGPTSTPFPAPIVLGPGTAVCRSACTVLWEDGASHPSSRRGHCVRDILDKRYRLRGWYKLPYGVYDAVEHEARFLDRRFFDLLMKCDDAPLTIMLDGAFAYAPGQDRWDIHYVQEVPSSLRTNGWAC